MATYGKLVPAFILSALLTAPFGLACAADTRSARPATEDAKVSGYSWQLSPGNHVTIVNAPERPLLSVNSKGGSRVRVEAAQSAIPCLDISLAVPNIKKSI